MTRVSKKTRPRHRPYAARTPADKAPGGSSPEETIERAVSRLLTTIAAGDLFQAELHTAMVMSAWNPMRKVNPDDVDAFVSATVVDGAVRNRTPEGAALLRLVMSLGSPAIKKVASQALARLTASGIYPPDWVTGIGKAVPLEASRRYDIFGDEEVIGVTFGYGESEHGIAVRIDLTEMPMATVVGVVPDPADVAEIMSRGGAFDRVERISLTEAHRRLAEPLARLAEDPDPGVAAETLMYLPIVRSRARRLPAGDAAHSARTFTAADRAAAVDEFLKSPQAAEAVAADEDATRFWAEVLTGYSSRIPGEAPAQVGPRKLAPILLGQVPNTFTLTPAQRDHLEPAVTAWAQWSAEYRGLDEVATGRLTEPLPSVFARFDELYKAPDAITARGYVADLAASNADISWLTGHLARRLFAIPFPGPTDGIMAVGDPAVRRALVEAEFGACAPHAGLTREEFMAAVHRVIAELWDGDPPETFQAASRLLADGTGWHDIIHKLAERKDSPAGR
jgi:hypothetical protein